MGGRRREVFAEGGIVEFGQRHIRQLAVPGDRVGLPLVVPVGEILPPQLCLPHLGGYPETAPELGVQLVGRHRTVGAGHVERLWLVISEPVDHPHRQSIEQQPVAAEGPGPGAFHSVICLPSQD